MPADFRVLSKGRQLRGEPGAARESDSVRGNILWVQQPLQGGGSWTGAERDLQVKTMFPLFIRQAPPLCLSENSSRPWEALVCNTVPGPESLVSIQARAFPRGVEEMGDTCPSKLLTYGLLGWLYGFSLLFTVAALNAAWVGVVKSPSYLR